jgi:hypothetical protein
MKIDIVWEFVVKPRAVPRFRKLYGARGAWAVLFRRHPGYMGTQLLQDTTFRRRFLTIDSWQSRSQFERMRRAAREEYARLDATGEKLTVSERPLGVFRSA